MIGFAMIGTNRLIESSKFYDAVLEPLDIVKSLITERYVGYSNKDNPEKIEFYITKPFNNEKATNGNGTMIALLAKSRTAVNKFYKIALEMNSINEGSPGPRDGFNYYAYIRDADGNKICAYTTSSV